jgi:Cu/Ag efflux pump CusA
LLGLTGVEGKLFTPIAVATIVSMLASFLVSLTLIPVLCSFLLNPKPAVAHQDAWIVRVMKRVLQATALRIGFEHPWPVLAALGLAVLAAFSLYPKLGKDFLPSFKEESALIAATSAP